MGWVAESCLGGVPFPVWRGGGLLKWVFRGGRGVDPDSEVWLRFPSVVVEVVGLRDLGGLRGRAYWEAQGGDVGPKLCTSCVSVYYRSALFFLIAGFASRPCGGVA